MKTILLQIRPAYKDFETGQVYDESTYLPAIKPLLVGRANVRVSNIEPATVMEVVLRAKEVGATCVVTTSEKLLRLLLGLPEDSKKKVSLADFAGSLFRKFGCEFLIVPPLEHLYTVNYGRHVYERYLKKFLKPEEFIKLPDFESQWEIFHPSQQERLLREAGAATFLSFDIETKQEVEGVGERVISCLGYTWVRIDTVSRVFTVGTCVIPFDDIAGVFFARRVLALPQPKVAQNGKYDIAYLLRYRTPVTNYAFDTINLFHSWYCELPKDLAFITTYLLREWVFWKDEGKSGDLYEYYRYNAKDCFATAMSLLTLMQELPQYALQNFLLEFPVVFPCILAEATGVRADRDQLLVVRNQVETSFNKELTTLRKMVNNPLFNPGSPQQVVKLFELLGCGDIKSSGKIQMDKVANRHPLNKRIIVSIKTYRENRKLFGTYTEEEKLWNGRVYYAINPHGTDTGRNASKESHFWCGLQIQNIPRDRKDVQIKSYFVSDPGFFLGESDLEQAEARDTAYLSGDLKLIEAVDDVTKDYHGTNASKFFAVPYEAIVKSFFDEEQQCWVHETLDKELRDLAKRTNHGANYNMGPGVMLDTMGIENVLKAKKKLGLPTHWTLVRVCQYLLDQFSETYNIVKGPWYEKVKNDIRISRMLVGPTGWTRVCFGNPDKNKRDLNSYVAHPPQSLNAMVLNQAFVKVFYNVWLPNPHDFKLHAQIHDSIFFSYRIGQVHLAKQVKKLMEIPVKVRDTFGIERTLLVPAALKGEGTRWSELKDIKGE